MDGKPRGGRETKKGHQGSRSVTRSETMHGFKGETEKSLRRKGATVPGWANGLKVSEGGEPGPEGIPLEKT